MTIEYNTGKDGVGYLINKDSLLNTPMIIATEKDDMIGMVRFAMPYIMSLKP